MNRLRQPSRDDPLLRSIGEKLGEGEFVRGDGVKAEKKDRVRELYPNDPPKEVKQQ
jgi:hypothetical protein